MKKQKTKKAIIKVALLFLFIAAYLFYSRPMDIQERYSMLSLDKCTEISGYYEVGAQAEITAFSIEKGSEAYQKLCNLLYERDYRRSLKDLLPSGTRSHRTEPDDFRWEVYFHFEDIVFLDESTGSGKLLRIESWYGDLDIHFDGDKLSCHTKEQEAWTKEVLEVIQ